MANKIDINKKDFEIPEIQNPGHFDSYPEVSNQGLGTNRAINNKWVGFVPLENALGKKYKNLELNLTRFTIPQITIGTTTTSYKGISFELPTHVLNSDSREITFTYVVDEQWVNYKSLYVLASGMGSLNPVTEEGLKAANEGDNVAAALGLTTEGSGVWTDLLDCRVWLLDNYKRRILDFCFHNCFIKSFEDLALDSSQAEEVVHSFTMAYTHMTLENPHT